MSLRQIARLSSALAIGAAAVLLAPTGIGAGQYQTLSTELVGPTGVLKATSSPKNSGSAMEIDLYEFKATAAAGGASYRCEIVTNGTGVAISLWLIGVSGAQLASCVTPVGGTCNTAYVPIGASAKPLCLVATAANFPVVGINPTYTLGVKRM